MSRLLFATLPLLFLTACIAPREEELQREQQQQMLRDREQRRLLDEYNQRTQTSLMDTESRLEELQREIRSVREESARAQARDLQALDQRVSRLEGALRELDQKRQKDREEIIDTLSRRMAELMSRPSASHAASGASHEVQPGETLSVIAARYGVSTRALIDANGISNPNNLRAGQRLVIPR